MGVGIDVLEILERIVGRDIGGLRNRGIDPLLRSGLDVDVLLRRDIVGGDEVFRQGGFRIVAVRHRFRVDQLAVGQQFVAVHFHFFLGLLAFADHVAAVMVRERRLDAVGGVVGQRQRNGAGRRDRAVVGEAGTLLGHFGDQLRRHRGHTLHVTRVFGVQHAALDLLAQLVAVGGHFRALAQHFGRDLELFVHDRSRTFFFGQRQTHFPAGQRHFARDGFGEFQAFGGTVFHLEHGQGAAQTQEAHAVTTLAHDLTTLLFQRQAIHFHHIVEHTGKHTHDFLVFLPIESGFVGESVTHEQGQIDRAEQAGAVRRQRLFAAGIGGADVFTPPVVVHFVDAVDQDEAGLGEIIRGRHDAVPQQLRTDMTENLAGHQAVVTGHIAGVDRPIAPDYLRGVIQIKIVLLFDTDRENQRPVGILVDGIHEAIGDQQ